MAIAVVTETAGTVSRGQIGKRLHGIRNGIKSNVEAEDGRVSMLGDSKSLNELIV